MLPSRLDPLRTRLNSWPLTDITSSNRWPLELLYSLWPVDPNRPSIYTIGWPVYKSVIDWDDLVDPADEWGDLDVDPRDVLAAAAEPPAHEAGQLVETLLILADKGTSAIALEQGSWIIYNIFYQLQYPRQL